MKGYTLTALFLLATFLINAQVLIGEDSKNKKTTSSAKKNKQKRDTSATNLSTTAIYLVANWSNSSRILTENKGYFGKPLGYRANESPLNTWSFGIGIRSKITKHLLWDGGISFIQNGEQYTYKGTDTTFSYQTRYGYLSMPFRINYTIAPFGDRFTFYAGVGLLPQMLFRYQNDSQWTSGSKSGGESVSTKIGYNSFVISALFNIGLLVKINNKWGCIISPEARIQFNSSYDKNSAYIHKNQSYGITVGLTRNI
jgi:hypothetical protein